MIERLILVGGLPRIDSHILGVVTRIDIEDTPRTEKRVTDNLPIWKFGGPALLSYLVE